MYIDYNKVIGGKYNSYISNEKLTELKGMANKERTYLSNRYCVNNITGVFVNKAPEIVYISNKYNDLSAIEKKVLVCNIIFNDEKFVDILKRGYFDIAFLQSYNNLVNYIKFKADNHRLSTDDIRYLNTVNKYTNGLTTHFAKYVGNVDKHIIINKLNEILTFNPELFEDNKNKHNR